MNIYENTLGQPAAGMLADLVILNRDLPSAAAEDTLRAHVDLTTLRGQNVFDRGALASTAAGTRT